MKTKAEYYAGEEFNDRFKEEMESLSKMSDDDRADIVKGYHDLIGESLSKTIDQLQKVQKLSPATIPLTKTAIILAEMDFLSDDLRACAFVGGQSEVLKLLGKLWETMPNEFEKVIQEKGYVKA